MIYRSNLTAPDLSPYFRHLHVRPMPHSFGHSVPSDWADKAEDDPLFGLYKNCGMLTHDEGAIVWNIAQRIAKRDASTRLLDIGCHSGWSTAHMSTGLGGRVTAIDPMLRYQGFQDRFEENLRHCWLSIGDVRYLTSQAFFGVCHETRRFDGVLIDGDHEPGKPLEDAINSAKHLADTGVIIFHDGTGLPVREAVRYLMGQGFHCRPYFSPHMLFLCWRGDFKPPEHVPDPEVKAQLLDGRLSDFDFKRCE